MVWTIWIPEVEMSGIQKSGFRIPTVIIFSMITLQSHSPPFNAWGTLSHTGTLPLVTLVLHSLAVSKIMLQWCYFAWVSTKQIIQVLLLQDYLYQGCKKRGQQLASVPETSVQNLQRGPSWPWRTSCPWVVKWWTGSCALKLPDFEVLEVPRKTFSSLTRIWKKTKFKIYDNGRMAEQDH